MRIFFCFIFVAWLTLGNLISAETVAPWKGAGEITFAGTSTLHDWSGKVSAEPFTAAVLTDDSGQPKQVTSSVQVKVASMDTAEADRDTNMRKSMKADEYPLVSAKFDATIKEQGVPKTLPFDLTLLGKTQRMEGVVSNVVRGKDKVTFDVDFDVSLKKSGIKVPSVLVVIRVGDTIKVKTAVTLTKDKP